MQELHDTVNTIASFFTKGEKLRGLLECSGIAPKHPRLPFIDNWEFHCCAHNWVFGGTDADIVQRITGQACLPVLFLQTVLPYSKGKYEKEDDGFDKHRKEEGKLAYDHNPVRVIADYLWKNDPKKNPHDFPLTHYYPKEEKMPPFYSFLASESDEDHVKRVVRSWHFWSAFPDSGFLLFDNSKLKPRNLKPMTRGHLLSKGANMPLSDRMQQRFVVVFYDYVKLHIEVAGVMPLWTIREFLFPTKPGPHLDTDVIVVGKHLCFDPDVLAKRELQFKVGRAEARRSHQSTQSARTRDESYQFVPETNKDYSERREREIKEIIRRARRRNAIETKAEHDRLRPRVQQLIDKQINYSRVRFTNECVQLAADVIKWLYNERNSNYSTYFGPDLREQADAWAIAQAEDEAEFLREKARKIAASKVYATFRTPKEQPTAMMS